MEALVGVLLLIPVFAEYVLVLGASLGGAREQTARAQLAKTCDLLGEKILPHPSEGASETVVRA